jgi:hypothetical protein
LASEVPPSVLAGVAAKERTHCPVSAGERNRMVAGMAGSAAQARIRDRLRAKERKCHRRMDSSASMPRHVSTFPLQMGCLSTARINVRRISLANDTARQ